jgi:glycosyltransferase involved in cell wall biosynthesis
VGSAAPLISVVIPCYNAERWIAETLGSISAQHRDDVETIVVDDGSSDGSAALVAGAFPWVRLICTPNGGPSRARNIGTAAAQGTYIQYLDADDLLAAGKLTRQIRALETGSADVAYGDWQRLVPNSLGSYGPGEIVARQIAGPPELALFTWFWCPPAAYLFRRSLVEHIGWNEGLPVIQDARFALDCALHGATFAYTPGIVAYYREHAGGSVSTRNKLAFWRDCFHNAEEVEAWWRDHGGLTPERREALREVYSGVAYPMFDLDAELFAAAHRAVLRSGGRVSTRVQQLALATRLLGHRRARRLVQRVRRGLTYVCRRRNATPLA